ncbi:ABC transporter ATP-binding protein [Flavobacteriaceae bacterium]|jgi:ABC-2 type transport system ATP-binding protein|nr:ABC transporter ATP-binding protein [Flavobacteriaceae bacterium]MDA9025524.1 ABC transporter ATP-binding protein [bacterium]MDA9342082.1 ABC transporter ATP-binding protein [Flavobacteriaceae bacterium]MDB9913701.1 ABC transporter ATP-binding protein [Flavobacteriaceae bacterium]MDB9994231.1 ABC transporter ATP-binding protein [Flavobacteriaceae bacterium]|tara:strand:- start:6 stop:749 length:744 start_codon:yes stop_codon:yes gene_type:complete
MLHIQKLSKKYKGADYFSVSNLDLDILKGEIFGVLGPNGAGKTTLISMLCSLIKPTSGTFTINNLDYINNKKELKQLIGIVPQEYALYPSLTAYENLSYFGSMYGLQGKILKKSIHLYLEKMGLLEFANKKIEIFSGGMKRRINLIASILHQPKILFLDEPTVGVDVQSKNVIIDHLKQLNKGGTTIVYTSHHLNEAEHFCSRVAIIDNGKIILKGTPKELISSNEKAHNLEDVFIRYTGKELRDHV